MPLPAIDKGKHTLKIHAIDKYAAFSKIVIYTDGFIKSNLGPAESFHAEFNKTPERGQYKFSFDEAFAKQLFTDIFSGATAKLPDVIYAGKEFWSKNRIYLKNEVRSQRNLGKPKYIYNCDKNIPEQLYNDIFYEQNGIIAFGTEHALLNTENAYLTPDKNGVLWEHVTFRKAPAFRAEQFSRFRVTIIENIDIAIAVNNIIVMPINLSYSIILLAQ